MLLRQQSVASLTKSIKEKSSVHQSNEAGNLKDHLLNELVQSETLKTQANLLNHFKEKVRLSSSGKNQRAKLTVQYYNSVLISKLACLKILQHAVRGGEIEVMGMLVGSTIGNQFVVFDCYELPVEGTETRVNAQSESYEYMVQYMSEMVPETQNIVGWYHSHPGYDCWLSAIDMHTQDLNQNHQDPYLAIVVDPTKSLQEKKLAIGAFRTFHVPSETENEDCDASLQFYDLNLSIFDSDLNKPLHFSKLKIEFPKFDLDADAVLLERLVSIFREYNSLKEMCKKSSTRNATSKTLFPAEHLDDINEAEQGVRQSGQMPMYQRNTRSSSFVSITTSANEDSDVDMDDQQLVELESVSSSVHTVTEPTSPYPRSAQLPLSAPRRPTFHAMELIFDSQRNNRPEIENNTEGLRNKTLRMDYYAHKKALLTLKIREYRKLRFLKDTFTL